MSIIFQSAVLVLIVLSFSLAIRVPVTFASEDGWSQNKGLILSGTGIWFLLIFAVGILNSFLV